MNSDRSLHVLYRSTGGDNPKNRPPYYTKTLCLRSLLQALAHTDVGARITFINDGPMPDDRVAIMRQAGCVISLAGIGNSRSYRKALELGLATSPEPFVYFAEDDYLYRENAFRALLEAFEQIPSADYITLFDHRDRYTRNDDAGGGRSRIYLAAGQHWRTVESTCMTFGARVDLLKKDAWIHRMATMPQTPRDRLLWRMTQGQKWFALKVPKRRLIGPLPSLATHMDPSALAPNVNWSDVAEHVEQQAEDARF